MGSSCTTGHPCYYGFLICCITLNNKQACQYYHRIILHRSYDIDCIYFNDTLAKFLRFPGVGGKWHYSNHCIRCLEMAKNKPINEYELFCL